MDQGNQISAARLTVCGLVQGVGFRAWTQRQARLFRLAGWVRNRDDGSVEILAEGDKKSLDAFVEAIKSGPQYSRVDTVDCETVRAQNIAGFSVIY